MFVLVYSLAGKREETEQAEVVAAGRPTQFGSKQLHINSWKEDLTQYLMCFS